MKRLLTPEIERHLISRYPTEGAALAEEFGVRPCTVVKWAVRLGVRKQRMTANHGYFNTWSSSMAYDLGYILTDGCVQPNGKLALGCYVGDESILAGLRDRLGSTNKLTRRFVRTPLGGLTEHSGIAIYSIAIVKCLMDVHGIVPRKSARDIAFPSVPDEFLPHFLRGALDGDGCVSGHTNPSGNPSLHIDWLGTHRFIRGVHERLLAALPLTPTTIYAKRHNLLLARWRRPSDLVLLHRFLYPSGDYPFLPRKRERLESHLRQRGLLK